MNHMHARCPVCQELFTDRHWRENPDHWAAWQAKLARLSKRGITRLHVCSVCGLEHYSWWTGTPTDYCSGKCRQKAYRTRRKAEVTA